MQYAVISDIRLQCILHSHLCRLQVTSYISHLPHPDVRHVWDNWRRHQRQTRTRDALTTGGAARWHPLTNTLPSMKHGSARNRMLPSCHRRCCSRLALFLARSCCDHRPRLSGEPRTGDWSGRRRFRSPHTTRPAPEIPTLSSVSPSD